MKKNLLIALLILAVPVIVNGQGFTFGPKAGFNIANVVGSDAAGTNVKLGFTIGLFGEYRMNDLLAFESAVMYSGQGAKEDGGDNGKANFSYINIPMLAKVYPLERLNFFTGPQIGFLAGAKEKYSKVTYDVKDEMRTAALDWVIGAGWNFDMGLNLFVNYNIGLTNIYKNEFGQAVKIQNGVFHLGAGWRF